MCTHTKEMPFLTRSTDFAKYKLHIAIIFPSISQALARLLRANSCPDGAKPCPVSSTPADLTRPITSFVLNFYSFVLALWRRAWREASL